MVHLPVRPHFPDEQQRPSIGRPSTGPADAKRDTLMTLYRPDPRVAPWTGTAHGVLQAVHTLSTTKD